MPGRNEAVMRTRCPACLTAFRVTAAQLEARAGKVRCGYCHAVFNARDHLLAVQGEAEGIGSFAGEPIPPAAGQALGETGQAMPAASGEPGGTAAALEVEPPPAAPAEQPAEERREPFIAPPPQLPAEPLYPAGGAQQDGSAPPATVVDGGPAEISGVGGESSPQLPAGEPSACAEPVDANAEGGVPAAGTIAAEDADAAEAARAAGLVAAREITEAPGYSRWADGVLDGGAGGLGAETRRVRWPYVAAILLLAAALLGQAAVAYRVDLVRRIPDAAAAFAALGIDVPLPRDVDQISIEGSDLQSDGGRGLLVLNAQLRNRAPYAQEWPALELTLTDAADAVVARRVLAATDYLPPGANLSAFPAASEAPVRIWIDTMPLKAGGYRLFVFYP